MANYMPHNQRSGDLLARLGFEKEGYAKEITRSLMGSGAIMY